MSALLKKEFTLCLHPTAVVFLLFAALVFVPNYPYEVMFFFSGLSVFFICLTARETGDLPFTCTLPVKKGDAARARILMCAILQTALLILCAFTTALKELCFPPEAQVNLAGMMANAAFLGFGALLLGVFDLVFFPMYFSAPQRVGIPLLAAGAAQFALIGILIVLRWTVPFFRDTLNTPDPAFTGVKTAVLLAGLALFALLCALAALLSAKRLERVDL